MSLLKIFRSSKKSLWPLGSSQTVSMHFEKMSKKMYLLSITFKDVQNVLGMTHFVSLSEVQDLCVCMVKIAKSEICPDPSNGYKSDIDDDDDD